MRGCLVHQDGLSAGEWTMTNAPTMAGTLFVDESAVVAVSGWVTVSM